jgi:hypothetical protein
MQVLAPKHDTKKQPPPTQEPAAQISLRAVTILEIASVLVSVFITVWAVMRVLAARRSEKRKLGIGLGGCEQLA